jgi:hypothetical protein
MSIFAVAIYDEDVGFRPPHRGAVKAATQAQALAITSAKFPNAARITAEARSDVDESQYKDGYQDV